MILEYLGRIGYGSNGNSIVAFMVGVHMDIEAVINSGNKVIVLGSAERSFYVERLLYERGVEVHAYADSSPAKQGASLRGKKIYSLFDFFMMKRLILL